MPILIGTTQAWSEHWNTPTCLRVALVLANDQLDRFRCERCGMEDWQAIAASGYRLTRMLSRTKFGRIRLRITKEAAKCVVNDFVATRAHRQESKS